MKSGLALVIGNVQYAMPHLRLVNAVNDAKAVSKKLMNLGFVVKNVNDCTMEDFDRALQEFGEELKHHKVGLFYYAGHGLQIDGKNFLTGTDTNFFDSISVKNRSVNLDEVIDRMQHASLEVKILVLDACRDNPLPNMRSATETGLAPIFAPKGTIIAFSTSPGERARDYGTGKNSIYTGAFLEHIDDANIPIEEFFKRVRTTVYAHSNGAQTSWEHTSLIGDFFFNSGQLIQSVNLPYKHDAIADALYVSSGSKFDEMIVGMRSHDWYKQGPAFSDFRSMKINELEESDLFLVGRNMLQMAVGGERMSERIFNNRLDEFLSTYSIEGENHLFNGILFEIYFNSKGHFRQTDFKSKFITQISHLQKNKNYKASFDFITRQLRPFSDYVFYIPTSVQKTLPIEIKVEKYVGDDVDNRKKAWKVTSIKNNNIELLHSTYEHHSSTYPEAFITKLAERLSAPPEQLRVTWSEDVKDNSLIVYPWGFKLSKIGPEDYSI